MKIKEVILGHSILWFLGFIGLFCTCSAAEILNPGFEINDPNIQGDVVYYFPLYWDRMNNAQSVHFFEEPDLYGGTVNWTFGGEDYLSPVEGEFFALLDTEDVDESTQSSVIQVIDITPGDRICGAYFFATKDYTPYIDYASIYLTPSDQGGPRTEILAHEDVYIVGSYGSTDGWQRFCYTIPPSMSGSYILGVEVANRDDDRYASYFAVDDLSICSNGSESDLNYDCITDNRDYQILSLSWDCDCSDPNAMPDPNECPWELDEFGDIQILFEGDIDKDNAVTMSDLLELLKNWVQPE